MRMGEPLREEDKNEKERMPKTKITTTKDCD
jgi:hypothetical protein